MDEIKELKEELRRLFNIDIMDDDTLIIIYTVISLAFKKSEEKMIQKAKDASEAATKEVIGHVIEPLQNAQKNLESLGGNLLGLKEAVALAVQFSQKAKPAHDELVAAANRAERALNSMLAGLGSDAERRSSGSNSNLMLIALCSVCSLIGAGVGAYLIKLI